MNFLSLRLEAAELRAAVERVERVKEAKNAVEEIRKSKKDYARKERKPLEEGELEKARASTTDPEARIMKMACGGFRPAYNVQFASTNTGKAIISVDVTNSGCDNKQLKKMIDNVCKRYENVPSKWFVDGGYDSAEELNMAGKKYPDCKVYMPVKTSPKQYEKRSTDTDVQGEWRIRMGTEEAQKSIESGPQQQSLLMLMQEIGVYSNSS